MKLTEAFEPLPAVPARATLPIMVKMKSRLQFPINGWWFTDPAISDQALGDLSWDFSRLCQEVQKRRLANPRFNLATDMASIEGEVDLYNAKRMLSQRGGELYIQNDGGGLPSRPAPRSQNWSSVAGGLKAVATGAVSLGDWQLHGGQPVPAEQSAQRAATCVARADGSKCPKHFGGDWLAKFTGPVQAIIQRRIEARLDMKLTTPHDGVLQFCSACDCPMKLKVHEPPQYVQAHTSADTRARLDPGCWILSESKT